MKKVYIIHGWAYGLEKWDQALELFKEAGIATVMLEVPGLTKESEKVWGVSDYVAWLDQQLQKEKEPVVLLGHSNGGRIALNYTLRHPKKVKQLILLDSAGIYHNDLKIKLKRSIFKVAAKTGKLVSKSPQLRKVLYKLAREKDYHDAPENMRRTMANMLESDKSLDVRSISAPTIIIWGDSDTVTPVHDAYALQSGIKNASIHFIKDARHSPHYTHPEEFASIVGKVLK